MTNYQIFISYRRTGGEDLAGRLSDKLTSLGYRVFYDVESMRSGTFNTQIYEAIEGCEDVLLILPPNSLDRCKDPEDWVRLEIEHSIRCKKNIIPVFMRGFQFPAELPPSIDIVRRYEGVNAISEFFNAVVERIETLLQSKRPSNSGNASVADNALTTVARFLNYGMYPQAVDSAMKAMQTDMSNAEVYYYAAIAMLGGKRPFLVDRGSIKKAEEYLNVALSIEPKGLYAYLLAYIKLDYYEKKMLRSIPDHRRLLADAVVMGITEPEIAALFKLLRTERPAEL